MKLWVYFAKDFCRLRSWVYLTDGIRLVWVNFVLNFGSHICQFYPRFHRCVRGYILVGSLVKTETITFFDWK